jgi:hypothetical protein
MRNLVPEDRLLFICTRQDFLEEHRQGALEVCRQESIKWDMVFSTAQEHCIAPLIYVNLGKCKEILSTIPQHILEEFECCYFHNIITKEVINKKVDEALSFFNKKSIDVMIIKGYALDTLVYKHKWYTALGDVDIIIRAKKDSFSEKERKEITNIISTLGIFECEYFEHHDMTMNGSLPINFHRIWADGLRIEFGAHYAFVMSPEDMLISVCINSCRKRFFKLKALCDIAEVINKYNEMNWAEFIRKAKEYRCNNVVFTALYATKMTVGCGISEDIFNSLTVNPVRSAIIRYLSRNMSFSSLYSLHTGHRICGKRMDTSLFLPYSTYNCNQVWRNIVVNWRRMPKHVHKD